MATQLATGARRAAAELPLLVVAALLLSTGSDFLPGDTLVHLGQVDLNLARILLVAGFAALLWTHPGPRRELLASGLAIPLALLLLAGLVATLKWGGTEPRYRFLVESVALLYLTVATIRARPQARTALVAIALVAVAVSALGGVEQVAHSVATGFYRRGCLPITQAPPGIPSGTITRAIGSFDNPNLLAGHILLLAPLAAVAVALLTPAWQARRALALVVALSYLGLVLTFSRTGILFAVLGAGAAVLASRLPQKRYLAGIALALAVSAFLLFGSCGSEGAAGFGRTQEWKETMHVIRDHPVYGVGLGRLGDVLHARNALSTSRHAHNLFLNWWAEAGPLALIAWIWLFAVLAWRSLRAALADDPVARGTLVALLGFFAYSMFDHPANVDRIAIALWVVMGIAAALPRAPLGLGRPRRRAARA
jgi:O-antigen ligase